MYSNPICTLTWTLLSMSVVEFFISDMFTWPYFRSNWRKNLFLFRVQITNKITNLICSNERFWTQQIGPFLLQWSTRLLDQQVIWMILQYLFCFLQINLSLYRCYFGRIFTWEERKKWIYKMDTLNLLRFIKLSSHFWCTINAWWQWLPNIKDTHSFSSIAWYVLYVLLFSL